MFIFLLEFEYLSVPLRRKVRFLFKNKPVPFARRHSAYARYKIKAVAGQHLNNYTKTEHFCVITLAFLCEYLFTISPLRFTIIRVMRKNENNIKSN